MGLSDFELAEELGAGAAGRVLAATHRATDTPVALKLLRPRGPAEALALERELSALARLHHPAILHLYDHGISGPTDELAAGTHWMALELGSGGSLAGHLPSDWSQVEAWLRVVLQGLAHAHARGVIHRDLKPANLVRCSDTDLRPGLKIADFGLAWALHDDTEGLRRAGTPHYMPPEQIRGDVDQLGPWSDLYALAAMLWEWTTGTPPFGWLELRPALRAHQHTQVGPLRPRFEVPSGLEALLHALLSKEVRARPPTAAHVLAALDELEHGFELRTTPLEVPTAWQKAHVSASTAVLAGAGLGLFALRDPPLVARQTEQAQLWETLRRVHREGRPAAIALTGTVGVGGRRLARWFRERIAELGCAQVAHPIGADAAARLRHLQARARRGPVVVDLCGVPHGPELAELAGAVLLDAERTGPVLLLMRGVEEDRLLRDLSGLEGFRQVPLAPLSRKELTAFLHEHLGLADGPAETVTAGSDGNPGLALAWVRGWVSHGALVSTPAGFRLRPGADASPPANLDDARRAQLDGVLATLERGPRLALALGAMLGTEVRAREWLPLLQSVGLDRQHSPVRVLSRANLVEPTETGWRILDPAVRLALMGELPKYGEPTRFHAAAAAVLEPLPETAERLERRGRHLLASGAKEEAWVVLAAALDAHRAGFSWTDVRAIVELLAASFDVPRRGPMDRYTVRYFHLLAVANLVSPRAAVPLARRALALAPELDDTWAPKVYRVAAEVLALAGEQAEARAVLLQTDATHARMRRIQAMLDTAAGRYDQAIAEYRRLWDESGVPAAANGLGTAHALQGDVAEAERWFLRCVDHPQMGHQHVPLVNLALLWLLHGEPARALHWIVQTQEMIERAELSRRGWVAVITVVIAAANGEAALLDRLCERALFHAQRVRLDEPEQTLQAIECARATAPPEHHEVLELLEQRVRATTARLSVA